MNNKDLDRLRKVFEHAEKSTYTTFHGKPIQMAAGVWEGNKFVTLTCNENKTHPLQLKYNTGSKEVSEKPRANLHAEMKAIVELYKRGDVNASKCTVYIARRQSGNKSKAGLARPCPACMSALRDIGIKQFCYTTEEGYMIETITEV